MAFMADSTITGDSNKFFAIRFYLVVPVEQETASCFKYGDYIVAFFF